MIQSNLVVSICSITQKAMQSLNIPRLVIFSPVPQKGIHLSKYALIVYAYIEA